MPKIRWKFLETVEGYTNYWCIVVADCAGAIVEVRHFTCTPLNIVHLHYYARGMFLDAGHLYYTYFDSLLT